MIELSIHFTSDEKDENSPISVRLFPGYRQLDD